MDSLPYKVNQYLSLIALSTLKIDLVIFSLINAIIHDSVFHLFIVLYNRHQE